MAGPPEDPPGGLFGELPEEHPDDRFPEPPHEPARDRFGEPGEGHPDDRFPEPPHEPARDRFGEPSHEAADDRFPEPPHEPARDRFGEPGEEHPDDRFPEPPHEPATDRFGEPSHEAAGDHFHEPPPQHDRFREQPRESSGAPFEEPADAEGPQYPEGPPPPDSDDPGRSMFDERFHESLDEQAGELSGDAADQPTGEYFDESDDLAVAASRNMLGDLGEEVHSPAELAQRRHEERAQRRRAGRQRLLVLIAGVVVVVVVVVLLIGGGGSSTPPTSIKPVSAAAKAGAGPSHLSGGLANAGVIPANILIADRNNNRLLVISPQGQTVWQTSLSAPGDAYFSSTGRSVIVTQHLKAVVVIRGVDSNRIDYSYGHANTTGSGDDRLNDPQTAHLTATGRIVIADLGNCRIVFATKRSHKPVLALGDGQCAHKPTTSFAQPDAVFPTADGGLVVTERSPAWIDVLSRTDTVASTIRLTSFGAPSDANEFAPGRLIVTDRAHPGAVEELSAATGKATWIYSVKSGNGELNRPTLARVLPNGDVLVADSLNDRLVVIDPKSDTIVWQYGHTGKPGSKPGYLHTPDSVDLFP